MLIFRIPSVYRRVKEGREGGRERRGQGGYTSIFHFLFKELNVKEVPSAWHFVLNIQNFPSESLKNIFESLGYCARFMSVGECSLLIISAKKVGPVFWGTVVDRGVSHLEIRLNYGQIINFEGMLTTLLYNRENIGHCSPAVEEV